MRIVIVGTSGSGKTTAARELSRRLGVEHHELDALYWLGGWRPRDPQEFRARVAELAARPAWIIEGHDARVRDLTWSRADAIVWLDLPLPTILARALRRTVRRVLTREPLGGGNVESLRRAFLSRQSPLLWVLKTHRARRREWESLFATPARAGLRLQRVRKIDDISLGSS
ncbi:MAG: AAA family ATPase [Deltaproteobacteria bacterium]|nr:AAA family ATPase [Deltaproteobacteria bacterium]